MIYNNNIDYHACTGIEHYDKTAKWSQIITLSEADSISHSIEKVAVTNKQCDFLFW